jgi:hypothetical protein
LEKGFYESTHSIKERYKKTF